MFCSSSQLTAGVLYGSGTIHLAFRQVESARAVSPLRYSSFVEQASLSDKDSGWCCGV